MNCLTPVRGEKKFHDFKTNTLLQAEIVHIEGCSYYYKRPGFKATHYANMDSMSAGHYRLRFNLRSIELVHCEEAVV